MGLFTLFGAASGCSCSVRDYLGTPILWRLIAYLCRCAVASLPDLPGDSALADGRLKRLLVNIDRIMKDDLHISAAAGSVDEFKRRLRGIVSAERTVVMAARIRERTLHDFIEFATHSHGHVLGHYLDDLIVAFSDMM